MQLLINDWTPEGVEQRTVELLKSAGERVMARLGGPSDEAGLTLADDAILQEYNRDHRGVDAPTDVLSFALDEGEDESPGDGNGDWPHLVGDVLISVERARAQSEEYGHSFERELVYLLVHGLLHLYGHDHMTDEEKSVMRASEEQFMGDLGLGRD